MDIKVIITIVKTIIVFSVALVLLLGIIGGGLGAKQTPDDHPFYPGRTKLVAHRGVSDKYSERTLAAAGSARKLEF